MGLFSLFTNFLKGPVGNNLTNDPRDVLTTKQNLARLGLFNDEVYNGYITQALDQSIRNFQKNNNLRVDGIMHPGGETERALFGALENRNPDSVFGPEFDNSFDIGFGTGISDSSQIRPQTDMRTAYMPERENPAELRTLDFKPTDKRGKFSYAVIKEPPRKGAEPDKFEREEVEYDEEDPEEESDIDRFDIDDSSSDENTQEEDIDAALDDALEDDTLGEDDEYDYENDGESEEEDPPTNENDSNSQPAEDKTSTEKQMTLVDALRAQQAENAKNLEEIRQAQKSQNKTFIPSLPDDQLPVKYDATGRMIRSWDTPAPIPDTKPKWIGAPVVNLAKDRENVLIKNLPAKLEIKENPSANNKSPFYEIPSLGKDAIQKNDRTIQEVSKKNGVDPDLVRSIIWAENARGAYGGLGYTADKMGVSQTVMPMNVDKNRWGALLPQDSNIYNAKDNIEAGTILLKRIGERIENPTPDKIGSIWVFSGSEKVNNYGAYVGRIYSEKPWLK